MGRSDSRIPVLELRYSRRRLHCRDFYVAATNFATPNYDPSGRDVRVHGLIDDATPVQGLRRLRKFSVQTQYINIASGAVAVGPIQPGWLSAQWNIISKAPLAGDPPGQFVYWIQNRSKPDEYPNIESGSIQSTPIQPDWLSARWTFELVAGTNVYQIHNVGQPDKYLNIANGIFTAGPRVTIPPLPPPGQHPEGHWRK